MGFFSTLIKGIGTIATPILGALGFIPPRAAPAPAVAAAIVPPTGLRASLAQQLAQRSGIGGLQQRLQGVGGRTGGVLPPPTIHQEGPFGITTTHKPFPRGNGRTVRTTVVTTTDLFTGEILRQVELDGAPFLMNKDVQKLRQTAKKLTRAHGKLPRRTVKESMTKQLTDAAIKAALDLTRCSNHKE